MKTKQPKQEPEQTEQEKEQQHAEEVLADYSEQQRIERREAELENEQPSWNLN